MAKDDLNTTNQNEQAGREKPQDIIEIVDENLKYGFAQMPRPVLRAKGLSLSAKAVYMMLLDYAWQNDYCFPGQDRLAQDLDISRRTVIRALDELRQYKLIDWKRQGLNKPNIYFILKLSDNPHLNGKCQIGTSRSANLQEQEVSKSHTNNTKSKNTQIKNTKSFRKAHALTTEKGGEGVAAPARSHIARMTTRNRNIEETNDTAQGSGSPPTQKQTPTQKRVATIETSKQRTPAYIGKPLTQEEIDENRRNNRNASGLTPLAHIIPASHWQELEARAAAYPTNGNGNGIHYSTSTKRAPDFIDALIEQFSKLLHDEVANIPQNINRTAKLYRQSAASEELFITSMHDAYTAAKRKQKITTLHSDGRPNKMPYFFSVLADKLGVKPNQPT